MTDQFVKRRMEVAAAQRPRRNFDQICEILGSFITEIRTINHSITLVRNTRPALFGMMVSVFCLQAVAFGVVFSSYILALFMTLGLLLLPVAYEWGFPNQMNEGNRTLVEMFNNYVSRQYPTGKTKWIKMMNNNADDTEWEKDFASVPETDGEIPVMIVPKKRSDEVEQIEDQQKKNVDSIASLIKKLTEEAK
ncbi:hypothetical protein K450DRAFT_249513 [Umbelopsis ramanniana AG]|uniref:Uncharacterized protein n=1 Tax=Umbelopsis ramanniana AG TaxID=1314678 RepID=A0AAD5E6J5_UMBRA|nr:uncharacterized protein K450DRAFT_249513 [Umbelopsis ramanniana AG]KAI8578018.1 hypothetical protein K450DRAFT_249513 [Umbelopsis ramanniana AG]